jgi:hypothetical protein
MDRDDVFFPQAISEICPQLRALDVSFSPFISEVCLQTILAACPNLEELDMSSCRAAASDAVLETVGRSCRSLGSLYLEVQPSRYLEASSNPREASVPSIMPRPSVSLIAVTDLIRQAQRLQVWGCMGKSHMCQ